MTRKYLLNLLPNEVMSTTETCYGTYGRLDRLSRSQLTTLPVGHMLLLFPLSSVYGNTQEPNIVISRTGEDDYVVGNGEPIGGIMTFDIGFGVYALHDRRALMVTSLFSGPVNRLSVVTPEDGDLLIVFLEWLYDLDPNDYYMTCIQ